MFEQDYIIRQIRIMIAVIMEFFGIKCADSELLSFRRPEAVDDEGRDTPLALMQKLKFHEAEDEMFRFIEGHPEGLRVGLAFYDMMSSLDPDLLAENGYTGEDMADGMTRLLKRYGLGKYAELFEI